MKKRLLTILIAVVAFGGGIVLGFYIRGQTLNPRAVIPGAFERVLTFLIRKGEEKDDDLLYHNASLAGFIAGGSNKTKVAVEGVVYKIIHEPDDDYHILLRGKDTPDGPVLVTEFIPEIKLPLPQENDYVKIWGITRFDEAHDWWEIHPVVGWEKLQ